MEGRDEVENLSDIFGPWLLGDTGFMLKGLGRDLFVSILVGYECVLSAPWLSLLEDMIRIFLDPRYGEATGGRGDSDFLFLSCETVSFV